MADRSRFGIQVNGKKTLTDLCTSKMCIDVGASDFLKAHLGTAGISKAVKQCTNLDGGLVGGSLVGKPLHGLMAGEISHLSSNVIGMSGIEITATPRLDYVPTKSDTEFSFVKSQYSIAGGLMAVQNLSGLSGGSLGIKKVNSDLHDISMDSSKAFLETNLNIAAGGCVLDSKGLDEGAKLNQDKVKVNPKSLNKDNTGIPKPAVFANCQFALDLSMNMSFSEKTNLRKAITGHGGIVSFIVTKKSTHVICGDPGKADTSYKCKMATKYGIPIICVDYIRDCIDKGRLLNTDGYLLWGKTKAEELKLGKISASREQKQETKQKVKPAVNMKNVKIWTYGEKDCPVFDEENYQIAKYAMFKKLNKSSETTTFCVLELHVVDLKVDRSSEHRFRVFCHHGVLHDVEEGQAGNKEIRFAQTSEEAVAIYVHLYHEQMKPPQSMTLTFDLLSRHVGSHKFKQMMEEIGAEYGVISPAVSGLVNYVWEEAVGNLQQNLRGPLSSIKTEQIDKAEGILKQMREALDENNTMRLSELIDKFYVEIPYQQTVSVSDINKAWISRTFDLCQLIRDLIAVSEATDWSFRPSDQAKYNALRCNIEHLESTSPEFKTIKDYLMQSLEGGMSLKVERIFHVHRLAESSNFRMDLEPRKLLFHSSRVDNFMGILSRGLLMPRVVVDDHGGKRTDPGMLGSGIYFAEAGSTSAGYSSPGKTKGTRLMLINDVALGSCFGTTKRNTSLTEPPEGYQSVHGIKATENCPSDFKVDEYVVYNTNQQKIKYLVEFTLPGDVVTAQDAGSVLQNQQLFVGRMDKEDVEDLSLKEVDLKDVAGVIDPVSKVKAGLVSNGDAPVDLKQVHISARLVDMVSQVVVIQEYYNNSSSPLEAKYVFPLDEMAAICGFEAFINGKHIIGEVKEKETAHREYKQAISEGHGAYLMDQDEETPDVFTISVGNLPPWATVFIKITYVAELQVEDELISFRLPGSVAPWSKDSALQDKTQSDIATVEVKQGRTSLLAAVEMPFDIRTIECPTHKVKLKKTLTKAMVELCDDQSLADGFQLLIGLAEIHVPRMWVERKDIDSDHQACMLSFYPEFEANEDGESNVIFLLDLSNSMKGAALNQAKKVLLLTLTHLPKQWTFNVTVFGTGYRELFPGGVCKTPENVKKVEKFVQGLKADMGNTEAIRPLHSLHLLKQESSFRNVFLITDGHVNNEETTLAEIHCHCQNTRIFTFGVSSTANRHLLRALARMGGGAFEFFDPKSKSKWEGKVKSQISKAGHIGLTSISVHWEQYNTDVAAPVQAPKNINAIFNGSRQVIYGFVPNCTMATLKAQIDGQEVSTVVSTSDLSITEGMILHRLTARAIIRDWEDGLLSLDRADQEIMKAATKNLIIELSKEYSIVTQFTSFVAIEKRDEDKEVDESEVLDMSDLIEREAMDNLQSMGYLSSSSSSSSSSSIDESGSCEESDIMVEKCDVDQDLESMSGMLLKLKCLAADVEEELHAQSSQLDRIHVMCAEESEDEEGYDCFIDDTGGGGGVEMPSPLCGIYTQFTETCHDDWEYEGEGGGGGGGGGGEFEVFLDKMESPLQESVVYESVTFDSFLPASCPIEKDTSPLQPAEDGFYASLTGTADGLETLPSPQSSVKEYIRLGQSLVKEMPDIDKKGKDREFERSMAELERVERLRHEEERRRSLREQERSMAELERLRREEERERSLQEEIRLSAMQESVPERSLVELEELRHVADAMWQEERSSLKRSVKSSVKGMPEKETKERQRVSVYKSATFDSFLPASCPIEKDASALYSADDNLYADMMVTSHRISFETTPSPQTFDKECSGVELERVERLRHEADAMQESMFYVPPRSLGRHERSRLVADKIQEKTRSLSPQRDNEVASLDAVMERPLYRRSASPTLKSARFSIETSAIRRIAESSPPGIARASVGTDEIQQMAKPRPPVKSLREQSSDKGMPEKETKERERELRCYMVLDEAYEARPLYLTRATSLRSARSSVGTDESQQMAEPSPPNLISSEVPGLYASADSLSKLKGKSQEPQPSVLPPPPPPPPPIPDKAIRESLAKEKFSPPLAPPIPPRRKRTQQSLTQKMSPPLPPPSSLKKMPLSMPLLSLSAQRSVETSPQVSWRTCSFSEHRCMRNIYSKSEGEVMGAIGRLQARSIDLREFEPLLDSLDLKEESLMTEEEAVQTDLGCYGIGVNVECIAVRPMKGLPASTVECIMKLQKEDGHWEFDADLEQILGVDKNQCLHILYTSGLKSLGESVTQAIIQLAATLIVLLSIYKELFPSSRMINLRQVDEQNNVYKKIRITLATLGFGHQFDNALAFCNRMKKQYSLVPATLELGKSWEEIVGKMLDIHSNKLEIMEVWVD